MDPEERLPPVLMKVSIWCMYITAAISALSLSAWATGSLIFASYSLKYIPIAPSTALMFLLLSSSFLYYLYRADRPSGRPAASVSACMTLLLCSILLGGYLLGATFEAEHLGLNPAPYTVNHIPAGHMSPITALTLIIASLGVLFLVSSRTGEQRYKNTAAFLGLLVVLAGAVVVLGYVYETPLLYGGRIIPMAFPTAIVSVFLGMGLVSAAGRQAPPMALFAGPSVQSRLMRHFLPIIIAVFLAQDLLIRKVLYISVNPALLSALTTILTTFIVSFVIERISNKVGGEIDQAIAERRKSEAEREKLIAELRDALANVKQLSGMLPICSSCKKIKDDRGYWEDVASYITMHSDALFSHSYCPECAEKAMAEVRELTKNSGKGTGVKS